METVQVKDCLLCRGDAYEFLEKLPAGSARLILTDPPYGTTDAYWDAQSMNCELFWKYANDILPNNAPAVIFSQLPFLIDVVNANRKNFRYEWVWHKPMPVGFLNGKKMPMRCHENILVFYRNLPPYNPQMWESVPYKRKHGTMSDLYGVHQRHVYSRSDGLRYPRDVVTCSKDMGYSSGSGKRFSFHPAAKPLALLRYMILTYTNVGDVVIDPFMGAGTTAAACMQTGRKFIGCERDQGFFDQSVKALQDGDFECDDAVIPYQAVDKAERIVL